MKFQISGADDIAECRVSVDRLDLTGHIGKGWIFADEDDIDLASATFVYVPGHGDRYDVLPFPGRPWAAGHEPGEMGYNLAAAVRIVQGWVREYKANTQPKED